jgi:hypothetical protein
VSTVTALRTGRQRALVQRPRRKAHLASIAAGETVWLAFCDRDIEADGALFWIDDAEEHADQHPDEVCAHCTRFILLTRLLFQEHGIDAKAVAR